MRNKEIVHQMQIAKQEGFKYFCFKCSKGFNELANALADDLGFKVCPGCYSVAQWTMLKNITNRLDKKG